MSVLLVSPAASGIKTYTNGIKVIRLHEYLGPARASLSTASDSWSVCGTVVRDTQQLSYTGSDPNRTIVTNLRTSGTGLDTCRIPIVDVGLDPINQAGEYFKYRGYIGVRTEGTVDEAVQNSSHKFYEVGSNFAHCDMGRRNNALTTYFTQGGVSYAPNPETSPYFKVMRCGETAPYHFEATNEYLVIRAGSGNGGAFTWILDCLYLVPMARNFTLTGNPWTTDEYFRLIVPDSSKFDILYDHNHTNTYIPSRDDDSVDWAGQYSVMIAAPVGFGASSSTPIADYQIGPDERTIYNVQDNGSFTSFDNPGVTTDIVLVAGSHYTADHEIDHDDFDRTVSPAHTPNLGTSNRNRIWVQVIGSVGSGLTGIGMDGTQLYFQDMVYTDLGGAGHYNWPSPSIEDDLGAGKVFALGSSSAEVGTGATTAGHPLLTGGSPTHCTIEISVSTDFIKRSGFRWILGFTNRAYLIADVPSVGDFLITPSSELYAGLMLHDQNVEAGQNRRDATDPGWFDGPDLITSSYSAGTFINMKLEQRWYHYRGKVWLDGDSEPDWQFDGFIPEAVHPTRYDYPWTTHSTNGSTRRGQPSGAPCIGAFTFRPHEGLSGEDITFGGTMRLVDAYFKNFKMDYIAGGDDPQDIGLRLKKYDDSITYGTVTIPFESQRLVLATYGPHTFNNDDDGWSATTWKNAGSPEGQAAVISDVMEKIFPGGPIHLESIRFRPYQAGDA